MVSKELKNLSRRELVDIIYQMKKNEQLMQDEITSLQSEVGSLQEALRDKRIQISNAGSIAEAAISVTNLFSTAQTTADLYLQEIARMKQETQTECEKLIREAKQTAAEIISQSENQSATLNDQYRRECIKWHKLHQQVQLLEETVKQTSHED